MAFCGDEELGGIKASEAIGRKIAEAAMAPMDVLETASFVIRNGDAEPGLIILVPPPGDITYGKASVQQPFFQLIADHDMKMVGDLVGFRTDQGWLDLIDAVVKCFQRDAAELFGKEAL